MRCDLWRDGGTCKNLPLFPPHLQLAAREGKHTRIKWLVITVGKKLMERFLESDDRAAPTHETSFASSAPPATNKAVWTIFALLWDLRFSGRGVIKRHLNQTLSFSRGDQLCLQVCRVYAGRLTTEHKFSRIFITSALLHKKPITTWKGQATVACSAG